MSENDYNLQIQIFKYLNVENIENKILSFESFKFLSDNNFIINRFLNGFLLYHGDDYMRIYIKSTNDTEYDNSQLKKWIDPLLDIKNSGKKIFFSFESFVDEDTNDNNNNFNFFNMLKFLIDTYNDKICGIEFQNFDFDLKSVSNFIFKKKMDQLKFLIIKNESNDKFLDFFNFIKKLSCFDHLEDLRLNFNNSEKIKESMIIKSAFENNKNLKNFFVCNKKNNIYINNIIFCIKKEIVITENQEKCLNLTFKIKSEYNLNIEVFNLFSYDNKKIHDNVDKIFIYLNILPNTSLEFFEDLIKIKNDFNIIKEICFFDNDNHGYDNNFKNNNEECDDDDDNNNNKKEEEDNVDNKKKREESEDIEKSKIVKFFEILKKREDKRNFAVKINKKYVENIDVNECFIDLNL